MLDKLDLLNAIAPLNRGLLATPEDRVAVQAMALQIEDRNPTPEPLAAPELLEGNWKMLYTSSTELLGIDKVPVVKLGNVYQCVRLATRQIYNFAEIRTAPYLEGLVSVAATFEPVSEKRVEVSFKRAVFGLQRLLGYQSPNQFIQTLGAAAKLNLLQGIDFEIDANRPPGWLEITYLDKDLRIGRGNQGSLFVLKKVQDR
ncbi:MAG: PAP/fibrillin family protein [Cyanobacteria bacterium J06632_22]